MIPPIAPLPPMPQAPPAGGAAPASASSGGFANQVANALNQVQQTQNTASSLETKAAAGQGSITDAMIAATRASLATQVTVALTNKAITAFTDVMNLQI